MAKKWTEESLDALGEELVEFVKVDGASMASFNRHKGKGSTWLKAMERQCPRLLPYIKEATTILAEARRVGRPLGHIHPTVYTEEKLHKLGESLIKFVKEDGVWHLSQFSERHKRVDSWIYDLGTKYNIFNEYLTRARRIIGRKMFQYGMEKNPNSWMLKTWMPRFLNERSYHLEDIREETTIKAEATRDAIANDPDHPFWKSFEKYMEDTGGKASK